MLIRLMKKGWLTQQVTVTPATCATREAANQSSVADVATVAVANLPAPEMSISEEAEIMVWLVYIGETHACEIEMVLDKCRSDISTRLYVLQQAATIPRPTKGHDDRRHCSECSNLTAGGFCMAARRGETITSRSYQPIDDIPRRCVAYSPNWADQDRRCGRERWPHLVPTEHSS